MAHELGHAAASDVLASTTRRCGPSPCSRDNLWRVMLRLIAAFLPVYSLDPGNGTNQRAACSTQVLGHKTLCGNIMRCKALEVSCTRKSVEYIYCNSYPVCGRSTVDFIEDLAGRCRRLRIVVFRGSHGRDPGALSDGGAPQRSDRGGGSSPGCGIKRVRVHSVRTLKGVPGLSFIITRTIEPGPVPKRWFEPQVSIEPSDQFRTSDSRARRWGARTTLGKLSL
jgi:hypothetical protein